MNLPPLPTKTRLAWGYTAEQMQAHYQAGRAAALDEAVDAIETQNARRVVYTPDCIEIIRSLKS